MVDGNKLECREKYIDLEIDAQGQSFLLRFVSTVAERIRHCPRHVVVAKVGSCGVEFLESHHRLYLKRSSVSPAGIVSIEPT